MYSYNSHPTMNMLLMYLINLAIYLLETFLVKIHIPENIYIATDVLAIGIVD